MAKKKTEMMMPPGMDGKQHPAFDTAVGVGTPYYWDGSDPISIREFETNLIKPVIASAIANFWDDFIKFINNTENPEFGMFSPNLTRNAKRRADCEWQLYWWKRAARGECIENAVIVTLKWE